MGEFLVKCNRANKGSITSHCIVLDLDETLVHTFDDIVDVTKLEILKDPDYGKIRNRLYFIDLDDPFTKKGEGQHFYMWGLLRPYTREFLRFCFRYFRLVCIWTAGKRSYAREIVKELAKDSQEPHIVYHFEHCDDNTGRCQTKDLQKIISECPHEMNLSNTFIIDNLKRNFSLNPDNGIEIPDYDPYNDKISLLDNSDDKLARLIQWFMKEEVIKAADIRKLNKTKIFS